MRRTIFLSVPQPCSESWVSMTPTATGRHCAACAKTVVDFTLKTDAEILAYLAGAAGARTCGRFAAGQLERPLQRAAAVAPTARWRAWLAAAVALWAVREGSGVMAQAQAPAEWRARYWGGPVPSAPVAEEKATPVRDPGTAEPVQITLGTPTMVAAPPTHREASAAAPVVLRGVITDVSNNETLPGVTVLLQGTTIGTNTNENGAFELTVPAELVSAKNMVVKVSCLGYRTEERLLSTINHGTTQNFQLQIEVMGQLIGYQPWPWHPRAFYYWGKYWLTRPFRRS